MGQSLPGKLFGDENPKLLTMVQLSLREWVKGGKACWIEPGRLRWRVDV